MTYSHPAPTPTRQIPRILVAGLLVVSAAITATLGYELLAYLSLRATTSIDVLRSERPRPPHPPPRAEGAAGSPTDVPRSERRSAAPATGPDARQAGSLPDRSRQPPGAAAPVRPDITAPGRPGAPAPGGADPRTRPQRGAPGEADGVVPAGTTVFDNAIPGVARLNPALLSALRRAATDAGDDGVKLYVTSGWRSPKYQEQLLQEAISQYGSAREAARWVATPTASAHVSGDAVDIGPSDATAWLSRHGATYGLCQIYRSEPWHYELRPEAIKHRCPPMYDDPTHDPRMQQ